ncbi:MAG: hypothetical protein K2Y22_07920 [Candidatus Obscuribacterales bacterium]|nr:hypothetical protein [Candidatus Obscuribacterales bacterium]
MKIIGLTLALSLGFTVGFNTAVCAADQGPSQTTGIFRDLENVVDGAFKSADRAINHLHRKLIADSSSTTSISSEGTLRNVRDLAHRLMREAMYLIDDCEQRDMVVTGEPMLIQPQDVYRNDKRAVGWAQEAFDLGAPEAPRKKWVDADMAHLKQLIDLLKADMGNTPKDDQQAAVDASWANANAIAKEIEDHYNKLVDITSGSKLDNFAIGKEALGIYDASKRLEKPWTEVLRNVKSK